MTKTQDILQMKWINSSKLIKQWIKIKLISSFKASYITILMILKIKSKPWSLWPGLYHQKDPIAFSNSNLQTTINLHSRDQTQVIQDFSLLAKMKITMKIATRIDERAEGLSGVAVADQPECGVHSLLESLPRI